jgi:hypothetical protein
VPLSHCPRLNYASSASERGPLFLSHELAHHSSGNGVTIKQEDDIWPNERSFNHANWLWQEHYREPQALLAKEERGRRPVSSSTLYSTPGSSGLDCLHCRRTQPPR